MMLDALLAADKYIDIYKDRAGKPLFLGFENRKFTEIYFLKIFKDSIFDFPSIQTLSLEPLFRV